MALLRRHVAEKERARAASDILCRSLADETHQLRRTLAATAHMCQHLARSLDELQRAQGAAGERNPEVGPCACRPWGRGRGSVSRRSVPQHSGGWAPRVHFCSLASQAEPAHQQIFLEGWNVPNA